MTSTNLEALDQPDNFAPTWNRSAFNQNQTRQPVATLEWSINHM